MCLVDPPKIKSSPLAVAQPGAGTDAAQGEADRRRRLKGFSSNIIADEAGRQAGTIGRKLLLGE